MSRLQEAGVLVDPAALRRPHDIAVHGDLALVAGKGATLAALDVTEPARPRLLDFIHDDNALEDAQTVLPAHDGTWLVGSRDLHRVSVAPSGRLSVQATMSDRVRIDRINGMARLGQAVITACKHGRLTVLCDGGDAPRIVGARDAAARGEVRSPHDVAVAGDLVVTVDGAGHDPLHHLAVYRAEGDDPGAWPCAGLIADARLHGANRVRAAFGCAYAACYGRAHVAAVRLPGTNQPLELLHVAAFDGIQPTGLCLRGRMLAVAGGQSVQVFDLGDPAKPKAVAGLTSPRLFPAGGDSAHDLAYHRGHLLVTAQNDAAIVVLRLPESLVRFAECAS